MTRTTYTKQEQEPASSEVTEAAPGVLRLQLPISMPGLGHVKGRAPVEACMKELFAERAWGGMAAGGTFAHLAHLRVIGEADSSRGPDGLLHCQLRAPERVGSPPRA